MHTHARQVVLLAENTRRDTLVDYFQWPCTTYHANILVGGLDERHRVHQQQPNNSPFLIFFLFLAHEALEESRLAFAFFVRDVTSGCVEREVCHVARCLKYRK